jgi:glycosyltransferase involved in cell wall biosynthesis
MGQTSSTELVIFESHPIQYRAPVYTSLEELRPARIHVVYGSDFSIQGYRDPGFASLFAWDSNLLQGYSYSFLRQQQTKPLAGWGSLDGQGIAELLDRMQPKAILLNSLNYRFDHVAYLAALTKRLQVWMRCETQDQAFSRSGFKNVLRSLYYSAIYSKVDRAFPIGSLNRDHWLRHGLKPKQLSHANYCTPNPLAGCQSSQLLERRNDLRDRLGVLPSSHLVAFFGKFIPKKNPQLLFSCIDHLQTSNRNQLALVFVGNGSLQADLQLMANRSSRHYGIQSYFPGFINQQALPDWYLAADTVVLPSRRMGETWGLVVNEALQAGCNVVVSDAVGCSADFGGWPRVRVIPEGSSAALAVALDSLMSFPRDFHWAEDGLQSYSIESAAQALANALDDLV